MLILTLCRDEKYLKRDSIFSIKIKYNIAEYNCDLSEECDDRI